MIPPCPVCGGQGSEAPDMWSCVGDCGIELAPSLWRKLAEGVHAANVLRRLQDIPSFVFQWYGSGWNTEAVSNNLAWGGGGHNEQCLVDALTTMLNRIDKAQKERIDDK